MLSEQPMKAARSFIPMTEVCPSSPEEEGELGEEELAYRARMQSSSPDIMQTGFCIRSDTSTGASCWLRGFIVVRF